MDVILRVTEISVSLPFGEKRITLQPTGDLLYALSVPKDMTITRDGGKRALTSDSLRYVLHNVAVTLYFDADKEDF